MSSWMSPQPARGSCLLSRLLEYNQEYFIFLACPLHHHLPSSPFPPSLCRAAPAGVCWRWVPPVPTALSLRGAAITTLENPTAHLDPEGFPKAAQGAFDLVVEVAPSTLGLFPGSLEDSRSPKWTQIMLCPTQVLLSPLWR